MTQEDDPDPDAADARARLTAQNDIPLVVCPHEENDIVGQKQWCLPGLPKQSYVACSLDLQQTEEASFREQDAGSYAHGEASAGLQYWSSRLLR